MLTKNHYKIIGKKGGETTKKRYGKQFFKYVGKRGGRPKKTLDKENQASIIKDTKVGIIKNHYEPQ